jgi:hypothetical protein
MQDIRIIFLDLQIVHYKEPDKEANYDIELLTQLLHRNNCLYILLLWSNNISTELGSLVKSKIKSDPHLPKPLVIIDLDKTEYFTTKGDKFEPNDSEEKILTNIQKEIMSKIEEQNFFHIFNYWDNLINLSSNGVINSFSNIYENSEEYNKKMLSIIYELALANAGKTLKTDNSKDVVYNALLTLNDVFFDSFEKNLLELAYPLKILPYDENLTVTDDIKAKINKKILIADNNSTYIPGMIFHDDDSTDVKKGIKTSLITRSYDGEKCHVLFCERNGINKNEAFDDKDKIKSAYKDRYLTFKKELNKKIEDDPILVLCEVTPACDYAQNKYEKHRVLHGLLWPWELSSMLREHTDYLYISDVIEYEGKNHCFVFDFGHFHAYSKGQLAEKRKLMRLRQEILIDIQSKLASHVHRPGLTSLK